MRKCILLLFAFLCSCVQAKVVNDKGELNFRPTKLVLLLDDYICSTDQWVYCCGFRNWISGNEVCLFDSVFIGKGQHSVELSFSIPYISKYQIGFEKRGPELAIVSEPDSTVVMEVNDGDCAIKKALQGSAHNAYCDFYYRHLDYKLKNATIDADEKQRRSTLQEEWFAYVLDNFKETTNPCIASYCMTVLRVNFLSRLEELGDLLEMKAEEYSYNRSLWYSIGYSTKRSEEYKRKRKTFPGQSEASKRDSKRWQEIMNLKNSKVDSLDTSVGSRLYVSFLDSTGRRVAPCREKGKYVLVDFWASWCKPCRQEMSVLKEAAERYKERFAVFSVSLDANRYAWKQAIAAEGIQGFTHALGAYANGRPIRLVQELGIKEIPRNFLIDDQMRIVAKDLRGEQLMQVLDSLMSK